MPFDAFTEYSLLCQRLGRTPPSREWWNSTLAASGDLPAKAAIVADAQFDGDTERREGWDND